jgi:glycerol-3-phosphate dehydrogenase
MSAPGWVELAGGKLTTYRRMAEQAVDRVVSHLGARVKPCRTAHEPLLEPGDAAAFSGILPPPLSRTAVEHYCRNEWARHLDDVMARRTSWQYYLPDPAAAAAQVAEWMAELFQWTAAQKAAEVAKLGAAKWIIAEGTKGTQATGAT